MDLSLDKRLQAIGCVSTKVRVLCERYPERMKHKVKRLEKLYEQSKGHDDLETAFDTVCTQWYLQDTKNDTDAEWKLHKDIIRLQKMFRKKLSSKQE